MKNLIPLFSLLAFFSSNISCADWTPYPKGGTGPTGPAGANGATGTTGANGASPWATSGSTVYYNAGGVGIGTASPAGTFEVDSLNSGTVVETIKGNANAPAGLLFNATYPTSSLNATYVSAGSAVPTTTSGSPVVTAGKLDLTANTAQSVTYDSTAVSSAIQTGTIRFRYTPNYSGAPGTETDMLAILNGNSFSAANDIAIYHTGGSGFVEVDVYDNANSLKISLLYHWLAGVAGTTYEFEFDWDLNSGTSRLFLDGTQVAITTTSTGTRNSTVTKFILGTFLGGDAANESLSDVVVYNTVQHTSGFSSPISPVVTGQTADLLDLLNSTGSVLSSFDNLGALNASNITDSGLGTVSCALYADGSKLLACSTTSNTELSYVHGVTSAIQTQLNLLAPIASPSFTGTAQFAGTGILTNGPLLVGTSAFFGSGYEQETVDYSPSALPAATSYAMHVNLAPTGNTAWTKNMHGVASTYTRTIGANTTDTSQMDGLLVAVKYTAPSGVTLTNSNVNGYGGILVNALAQGTAGSTLASNYQAINIAGDSTALTGTKVGIIVGAVSGGTVGNALIADSRPTGNGWGIAFTSDTQNKFAGSLNVGGAVTLPGLASSSAATTGTLCWTTGTGNVNVDTTLACLASTGKIKQYVESLTEHDGLAEVMALRPISYELKPEFNPKHLGRMVGFIAEEVQKVDERLVARDDKGEVMGVRYMQLTSILAKSIQELNSKVDQLNSEIIELKMEKQ